jgi:signal transduction histidine kinase
MVYEMVAKDGKRVDVESSSFSIQFNGQQAFIVVVRNRTHQNLVERQLIDNEKLATLGTLTADIAHEINNPLGIILGNLVFLIENYDALKSQMEAKGFTDDQCGKLFSEIGEELADTTHGGETIRDIVRGLKSFSRSSVEEVAEVDLNQIVESAIHMTLYEFKYKAKLVRGLAEGLPLLAINPGKLQQVLVNLLINASQSFENNKSEANVITVRTGLKEGSLFVEITDTGKGIPDDVLAHIFEPFYTTKPAGMGTGLGLPICREIVRCFQGTLEVQTQVGKGTTFTVRLPLKNGLTAHSADPG